MKGIEKSEETMAAWEMVAAGSGLNECEAEGHYQDFNFGKGEFRNR